MTSSSVVLKKREEEEFMVITEIITKNAIANLRRRRVLQNQNKSVSSVENQR